jgi:hypothetical protein
MDGKDASNTFNCISNLLSCYFRHAIFDMHKIQNSVDSFFILSFLEENIIIQ